MVVIAVAEGPGLYLCDQEMLSGSHTAVENLVRQCASWAKALIPRASIKPMEGSRACMRFYGNATNFGALGWCRSELLLSPYHDSVSTSEAFVPDGCTEYP